MTPNNRRHPLLATVVPLAVMGGGAALTILGTLLFSVLTGKGSNPAVWVPSGAAAAGGWLAVVLLAIAVWHFVTIVSGHAGPPAGEIGRVNQTVRRYLTPALLGVGILIGFFFFK